LDQRAWPAVLGDEKKRKKKSGAPMVGLKKQEKKNWHWAIKKARGTILRREKTEQGHAHTAIVKEWG